MDARSENVYDNIIKWIEVENYQKALNVIEKIDITHPQYNLLMKKKDEIQELANIYEKKMFSQAEIHEKNGELALAIDVCNQALKGIPHSKLIRNKKDQLINKRLEFIEELEFELLLIKAESVVKKINIQTKIVEIKPHGWLEGFSLKEEQAEAVDIANSLYSYGTIALNEKDLATAERTLTLAKKLHENENINNALKELNQEKNKRKKLALMRNREKLIANFTDAYKMSDFNLARTILRKLELHGKDEKTIKPLREKLRKAIDEKVQSYLEKGIDLYGQGKYGLAINEWKKALTIDPENAQVLTHIERAEKVFEKLNQLREKQETNGN
jgi:tetratricopeptide (TPR) repeat protein